MVSQCQSDSEPLRPIEASKPLSRRQICDRARQVQRFLQLQVEQLVLHSEIQWARLVDQDPTSTEHRLVVHAAQPDFRLSRHLLRQVRAEQWLPEAPLPAGLQPIDSLTMRFHYYALAPQGQPPAYLLLRIQGTPSPALHRFLHQVAVILEDYRQTHQQLEQQTEQVQRLETIVRRVGHQLRHPLSLINLYAGALIQALPLGEQRDQLTIIQDTALQLDRSLTELMQCAKRSQLHLISQDLRGLVLDTLADFQGWLHEKQIQVRMPEETLKLPLDPLQMKQALNNLISNAIHFSPPHSELAIDWQPGPQQVQLRIVDDGPGLSPEDLPRLFQPFFTRRSGGTGLGLAITHKVIRDHGGKLWAQNTVDRGAEFLISLPRFTPSYPLSEDIAC